MSQDPANSVSNSPIESLPDKILLKIFGLVDGITLFKSANKVNKIWYRLAHDWALIIKRAATQLGFDEKFMESFSITYKRLLTTLDKKQIPPFHKFIQGIVQRFQSLPLNIDVIRLLLADDTFKPKNAAELGEEFLTTVEQLVKNAQAYLANNPDIEEIVANVDSPTIAKMDSAVLVALASQQGLFDQVHSSPSNILSKCMLKHPAIALQIIRRNSKAILNLEHTLPCGLFMILIEQYFPKYPDVFEVLLKVENLDKISIIVYMSFEVVTKAVDLKKAVDDLCKVYRNTCIGKELDQALETITCRLYYRGLNKDQLSTLLEKYKLPSLSFDKEYLSLFVFLIATAQESLLPDGHAAQYQERYAAEFSKELNGQFAARLCQFEMDAAANLMNCGATLPNEQYFFDNGYDQEQLNIVIANYETLQAAQQTVFSNN